MPNALLDTLGERYRSLAETYDQILAKCADEKREPNELEEQNLIDLRSQMEPLTERVVELRADEDRRHRAMTALTDIPDISGTEGGGSTRTPVVRVRSEAVTYRPADAGMEYRSFFADLYSAQITGDVEARSRLDRHNLELRALGTTVTGAGAVPPNWLTEEFAMMAHGSRPWADTIRRVPIDSATPVTIGVQTAPGADVRNQAAEGDEPQDGNFTAIPVVSVPLTKTGKVDVSRQLLDGSNPAVDGLVYSDLMGAYAENIETMVVAAFTALANGAIAGNVPIDLTTDQIPDGVIDAGILVRTQRHAAPNVLFCSEVFWGNVTKQKDLAGRPLVVTGYHGPQNARGLGEALVYGHVAGELVGMQVIPSWAGVDTQAYVVKADDLILLESSTMTFRYEEKLGPQSIQLGVWAYAVPMLTRYPRAIARITTTGALPPLALAEPAAKK
jgi:HK97 family phage major capsid protein